MEPLRAKATEYFFKPLSRILSIHYPLGISLKMERVIRIELTYQAWEARVLPLNYTRIIGVHGTWR